MGEIVTIAGHHCVSLECRRKCTVTSGSLLTAGNQGSIPRRINGERKPDELGSASSKIPIGRGRLARSAASRWNFTHTRPANRRGFRPNRCPCHQSKGQ
jgi:hypothetical protein